MRKIATIRTKFDLLGRYKQSDNYRNFLGKHKKEWEEILIGATINEIQGALFEYGGKVEVDIKKSRQGCWKICAYILVVTSQMVNGLYEIIKGKEEDICEIFAEKLNEKAKELLDKPSDDEEIIEIIDFEITPDGNNDEECE